MLLHSFWLCWGTFSRCFCHEIWNRHKIPWTIQIIQSNQWSFYEAHAISLSYKMRMPYEFLYSGQYLFCSPKFPYLWCWLFQKARVNKSKAPKSMYYYTCSKLSYLIAFISKMLSSFRDTEGLASKNISSVDESLEEKGIYWWIIG